jgi:uncharacterized protein YciW
MLYMDLNNSIGTINCMTIGLKRVLQQIKMTEILKSHLRQNFSAYAPLSLAATTGCSQAGPRELKPEFSLTV